MTVLSLVIAMAAYVCPQPTLPVQEMAIGGKPCAAMDIEKPVFTPNQTAHI
jgi:hypothetical protein